MEDKALRKGLSVAAIILTTILALLLSFNNANGLVYGEEVTLYGIPFIAAFAIPLLAVLIVLARCCKSTDTVEETMAASDAFLPRVLQCALYYDLPPHEFVQRKRIGLPYSGTFSQSPAFRKDREEKAYFRPDNDPHNDGLWPCPGRIPYGTAHSYRSVISLFIWRQFFR